ncbi:MAG: cation:proton antiporter, partial [Acidimicrobiia bacterium]
NPEAWERTTEIVVIVVLFATGLRIDDVGGWRLWRPTLGLLAITMPLTIGAVAGLGWALTELTLAGALLLGAVLAPTDPVLASDVQVGEPELEAEPTPNAEEDVRFTLTSEGGLNDALAFPFVYLAIHVARNGWDPSTWLVEWISWDLVGRILIGLAVGWLVGRLLGVVSFHPPGRLSALAETPQGFVAIGATLLAYGATELVHGYGFLAVFVAAVVLRGSERNHEFQSELHTFTEQTENLLVVGLLLLFGGSLVSGVLDGITWTVVLLALLLVFVDRPACGGLALIGSPLTRTERFAISFFGIRGFGSIYYLAYALSEARFPNAETLWAIVAVTLVVSIATHGITATPVMRLVDRARWRRSRRGGRTGEVIP